MYQNRTYQDLLNYNPLMKNTYFEVEKTRKDDPQPPRIRTHQLVKIPVIMDEPPDAQPRFRWMTSNWYFGEPEPHMKEWHEGLRTTVCTFENISGVGVFFLPTITFMLII